MLLFKVSVFCDEALRQGTDAGTVVYSAHAFGRATLPLPVYGGVICINHEIAPYSELELGQNLQCSIRNDISNSEVE